MGLMDNWIKNAFSIYDSEERTVLKIIEKIFNSSKEIIEEVEKKTDLNGDHKGSWQGLNKPTLSEEGMRAVVEDITDNKLPSIYDDLKQKDNEINETKKLYSDLYTPTYVKNDDVNISTIKYVDIINLYNELVTKYPQYVSRTFLGYDQSGTYEMFSYQFSHSNYNDWIVIDANIHGDDTLGDGKDIGVALYYFLNDLCNSTENDVLSYIKTNINLSVIPIANPYGFNNNTRTNSRGVDLNRNFPVFWDSSVGEGVTPLSENETKNIKTHFKNISNLSKNSSKQIIGYLALHCYSSTRSENPSYPYHISSSSPLVRVFESVSNVLSEKYGYQKHIQGIVTPSKPSADNYAERLFGIPSGTTEFVINRTDGNKRTDYALRQLVEYVGNLIYKTILLSKPKKKYSLFNVTTESTLPYNENLPIKNLVNRYSENIFESDENGNVTIPPGIDYIKIKGILELKNTSTTPETFGVRFLLNKNGSTDFAGFSFTEDIITLGGSNQYLQYKTLNFESPWIYVNEGDVFNVTMRKSTTTNPIYLTTSSFFVYEEVNRNK